MPTQPYFPEARLHLPFTLAGRQGTVSVYYGPNDDPLRADFDSIPRLPIPLEMCKGYPVMHARIDSYAGAGYRMNCGWIQIITRNGFASLDSKAEDAKVSQSIDLYPSMEDLGSPFCTVGPLATIFDAPCLNLGDNVALTWVADTFLTTIPLRSRDEKITWLAGFRWGYREYDPATNKPVEALPAEATDISAWQQHVPYLREAFDQWRFDMG